MKKNVIFIQTDQQRYDSLGCSGNPYAVTPNIDKLAEDGQALSRHIVSYGVCQPSRASLFSGLSATGHGLVCNGGVFWRDELPAKGELSHVGKDVNYEKELPCVLPTMADIFTCNGYKTVGYGKFHFQPHTADKSYGFEESHAMWEDEEMENFTGPYYGFEEIKFIIGHGEAPCSKLAGHYGRWLWKNHPEEAKVIQEEKERTYLGSDIFLSKIPTELHNTMWLANEACQVIEKQKDEEKPLMLYVSFPDPHLPYCVPEEFGREFLEKRVLTPASKENVNNYKPQPLIDFMEDTTVKRRTCTDEEALLAAQVTYASVALIDEAVGRIIDKLKAEGLYDDSIIVFTSDHGDFLGDFGYLKKSNNAANCLLNVPFILKPQKGLEVPSVKDTPMSNIDVLPTLCRMLDIDVPGYIQGNNIFEMDKETYMTFSYGCLAVKGDTNLTVYDQHYRYTYYPLTNEEELYDHRVDIKEVNNLAMSNEEEHKAICNKMKLAALEIHAKNGTCLANRYTREGLVLEQKESDYAINK